jgi:hypothetical protein
LKSKSNVTDIRSATIIDFSYASILALFAVINNTPISTTWAFLGLIAGREVAVATIDRLKTPAEIVRNIAADASKAALGLVISVVLAVGLPRLAEALTKGGGLDALLSAFKV